MPEGRKKPGTKPTAPSLRFWSKVAISSDPDGCWLWTGSTNPKGYGRFNDGSGPVLAHRWSYQHHYGAIDEEICVLHNCPNGDNPGCINPAHLWKGTKGDNNRDMTAKMRNARGSACPHSKFTEETAIYAMARLLIGEDKPSIARAFGVTVRTVYKIWYGERWAWLFDDHQHPWPNAKEKD